MAEQDGGTHIDSIKDIEKNYLDLATAAKALFTYVDTEGNESPIINLHYALVRQITHELIISLQREFNLDINYEPTNKRNLRGVSKRNIRQFGICAIAGLNESTRIESTRTKTPYRQMTMATFTSPENGVYVRLGF